MIAEKVGATKTVAVAGVSLHMGSDSILSGSEAEVAGAPSPGIAGTPLADPAISPRFDPHDPHLDPYRNPHLDPHLHQPLMAPSESLGAFRGVAWSLAFEAGVVAFGFALWQIWKMLE